MLASTKNENEKVVSAREPTPPILKCYLVSVSNEKSIFMYVWSAGYNFHAGGVGPLADTTFSLSLLDGMGGYEGPFVKLII